MRKALSPAELLLWSRVKNKAIGVHVRRQYPVGPYFLDFYVPAAKLCIEVDGAEHEWRAERDETRDRFLAEQGIATWRLSASELSRNTSAAVDTIYSLAKDRIETELKQVG